MSVPPPVSRRTLLAGLALASPALRPGTARAQAAFPSRPVSLIVPFPPGGTTDITMRVLAEAASRQLGQNVVIENRPGAANTLGAAAVARARPDGYLLTQLPASAIRVQILQNLPYDVLRDFTPVAGITGYVYGAVSRRGRFPGGWRGLIEEARRRPGQLSYGSTGANGTPHVTLAEIFQREGVELTHVPFRGDADGAQALLGGHIDLMSGGSNLGSLVDGGQGDWLNIWNAQRLRRWPEAPTLVELGYPDMVVTSPYGIVAPAGLPPAVLRTLHDAFAAAARDPAHLAALERFEMPLEYRNSQDFGAYLHEAVARERRLIERLGLRAA